VVGKRVRHSGVDGQDKRRTGEKNSAGCRWLGFKGGVGQRKGGIRQRLDRVPADRSPTAARTGGAPLFRQWRADATDARAPAVGGRGSEKREVLARMSRPRETRSGPSLEKQ
jgi:hypothetical protein